MISFSWPDILVYVVVLVSAYLATRRGFVGVALSLLGFIVGLVVAFVLYSALGKLLSGWLGWSPVWSTPIAFIVLWTVAETLFGLLARFIESRLGYGFYTSPGNRALAVLPGVLQGLLISAVLLTTVALMPVQTGTRQAIIQAPVSGGLVRSALAVERPFEGIFGPVAREALGFITVKPPNKPGDTPEQGIKLQFTYDAAVPDPASEQGMLVMVNRERTSRGLVPLEMDQGLRTLARSHADDMFKRGYFAHETPEGADPFDRMRAANIVFGLAGENLALAPTLDMAHDGLMNSPGHRANILNPGFRHIGIGVLDGGIYGKMFVQEFTD